MQHALQRTQENMYTRLERSPLGTGSFTENELLNLNALKTTLNVDILVVAINKAAYLLLSNDRYIP